MSEEKKEFDINSLVGKSLDEANKVASSHGFYTRVTKEDENDFILSNDYHNDRINFTIAKGLIIKAILG